ncbi:MAG: AIR synthase-related protein, partial [Caldanaerobacter sp.]
ARVSLTTSLREDLELFSESQSRAVVSLKPDKLENALKLIEKYGIPVQKIGIVGGDRMMIEINGKKVIDLRLEEIEKAWRGRIKWELEKS